MDINFNSYVHLSKLFLAHKAITDPKEASRFHLVNINSIAGIVACHRNSDYSASKFALSGFTNALRQELLYKHSAVKFTNFYPYYIDTGLFEGFKPTLSWILPTLKAEKVTRRMYQAIVAEEKEVFINSILWYLKVALKFLPLTTRNKLLQVLVGKKMEHF